MNKCLIIDALGYLDEGVVREYIDTRRRKKRTSYKKWSLSALAACLALIISVPIISYLTGKDPLPSNKQDIIYLTKMGQPYVRYDNSERYSSIVFNGISATNKIGEREGNFLVLSGEIDSKNIALLPNESYGLEIYMSKRKEDYSRKYDFEAELSQYLSEATLVFGEDTEDMKGSFSLVYSIDPINFENIKNKSSERTYEYFPQIVVYPGLINWGGYWVGFSFEVSQSQYYEEMIVGGNNK